MPLNTSQDVVDLQAVLDVDGVQNFSPFHKSDLLGHLGVRRLQSAELQLQLALKFSLLHEDRLDLFLRLLEFSIFGIQLLAKHLVMQLHLALEDGILGSHLCHLAVGLFCVTEVLNDRFGSFGHQHLE